MIHHSIGQKMIIGLSGHALTADEKDFIVKNNIGGVILFGRNIKEPKQVHELCSEVQSLRHKMPDRAPLFISIDMEGGRVARLKAPFTVWPPLKRIGDIDNSTLSFHFSYALGSELNAFGFNLDYAPCIDVFTNSKNTVIGDRAVSSDFNMVSKHASALVRGLIKANVIACVKHFPGHGNTLLDSHEALPVEGSDLQRLEQIELQPFKKAFRSRVEMCMMSHILYPNVDPDFPASLSEIMIQKVLKEQCRYRGLVITDDLGMKALTLKYSTEEIAIQALKAGNDILLYCNEPDAPMRALDALIDAAANGPLNKESIEAGAKRILQFKLDKIKTPDPMPLDRAMEVINNNHHKKVAQALASGELPADLFLDEKGELT